MNAIKGKRRLKRSLKRMGKIVQKDQEQKAKNRLDKAFWNIFKDKKIVEREWEDYVKEG